MNTTELEKIASLPAIQEAIRAQAEAIEAESLAMRLGELEGFHHTLDELDALSDQTTKLDAIQAELDRQRDELARQRAIHANQIQQADARHRAHARELRRNHGGELAATIAAKLDATAANLRNEIGRLRSLRVRAIDWAGRMVEKVSPDDAVKADQLQTQAEAIEKAAAAVMALQFAALSPQAIERAIRDELKSVGFTLTANDAKPDGWQVEGWERGKKRAV